MSQNQKDEFERELLALMKKYNVTMAGWDDYAHDDLYTGKEYEFLGEGWSIPIAEIKQ